MTCQLYPQILNELKRKKIWTDNEKCFGRKTQKHFYAFLLTKKYKKIFV
ncbi:MAG: hypothetical protein L6V93_02955 [Clostridiales bacterium]|nr:MAG: hypothetical protein L6V93_02955 [Clostridiales bacterium]